MEQAQAPAEEAAGIALSGLLEHQRLGLAGIAAAPHHLLYRADDDAGVLGRELAAVEGGGGVGEGGELAGELDLSVAGAGADVEVWLSQVAQERTLV